MIIKTKKVYYCEFCKKKKGLSASAMSIHEKHCTKNPNRICRVCDNTDSVPSIIKAHDIKGEISQEKMRELKRQIECPACILACMLQSGARLADNEYYNFASEMQDYWEEERKKDELASLYS